VGYSISIRALYCYAAKLARWAPTLARALARCKARLLEVATCLRISKYILSPRGACRNFVLNQSLVSSRRRSCGRTNDIWTGLFPGWDELWMCRCSRSHIVVVFDASCLSSRHEGFQTVATCSCALVHAFCHCQM
jgi:hypothetical protein